MPNADDPGLGEWYDAGGLASTTAFNAIFDSANPLELRIWGELTNDMDDIDGVQIDNVRLISHVVPIPAALPLMLCALAGLGFAGRRRA